MELGVMISIYEETDIPAAFWYATEAGFQRGQVTSFIHGIMAEEVRQIALAARKHRFHIDAVGCYINPLRPEDPSLHGVDSMDWRTLAENMGMMNGVERIVCWSGTLSKTLSAPNLLNSEEETFNNLYITLSGMLEQVRGLPVQILLEPFTSHVLGDPVACARMVNKFPGGDVKIVLDAPNLLSPLSFPTQGARTPEMIALMASAVGLVHLKDFAVGDDGQRRFLPVGQGKLDFGIQLRAIAAFLPEVPLVIENVTTIDEMRDAREFIENVIKTQGI